MLTVVECCVWFWRRKRRIDEYAKEGVKV